MHASAKYLIHATVRTSGVVERSDVVGAIFGQTEGLLGGDLDLRDLQESSKLGRIDVNIESEGGRSVGTITISSGLDRAETAVLAAALETMDRVGPCRAECTVTNIEDARAAKRRELVERATELLNDLEEATVTSEQLVEEVRKQARIEEITEYEGYPAGPRVADSDAIILVEGRADVRRLLKYGIRNAVAVEGTDVPPEIAELTFERNTTAFLDGDRGADLILRELQQVGDIDYVAFAPTDQSVEDLDRAAILSALRRKVPLEQVTDGQTPRETFDPSTAEPVPEGAALDSQTGTDEGGSEPASGDGTAPDETVLTEDSLDPESATHEGSEEQVIETETRTSSGDTGGEDGATQAESAQTTAAENGRIDDVQEVKEATDTASVSEEADEPQTLPGHVEAVISRETAGVRFLGTEWEILEEGPGESAFEDLSELEPTPTAIVLDGTLTQRLLDLAAQRGVRQIVAAETGEFVKQPTDVRVRTERNLESST